MNGTGKIGTGQIPFALTDLIGSFIQPFRVNGLKEGHEALGKSIRTGISARFLKRSENL